MKFNNGAERKKFEKQWEVLRKACAQAGMREEAIQEMYEYDWNVYKQERRFREHNQYIEESVFDESSFLNEGKNSLLQKYQEKFSLWDSYHINEEHQWIEDIDTEEIRKVLETMSESNKQLLTMYVIEGRTQAEIAARLGISRSAVADRISVIRKKMKKVLD